MTMSAGRAAIETWTSLVHGRRASITPAKGSERFADPQRVAKELVEIRIRWSTGLADLRATDRVIYPPPSDPNDQSPATSRIYDILAVNQIGRREGLAIIAERRADTL